MTIHELGLQGKQNIYNSMAAAIAARVFEVKDSVIKQSMIDFKSLEHRLEHVLTVHGIDFINDSKATNINAAWFALESMKRDVVFSHKLNIMNVSCSMIVQPPAFPVFRISFYTRSPVDRRRDVCNWSIKPNIKNLVFHPFPWSAFFFNRDPPI